MQKKQKHARELPASESAGSEASALRLSEEKGVYMPAATRERRAKLLRELNAGWSEASEAALLAIAKDFGLTR